MTYPRGLFAPLALGVLSFVGLGACVPGQPSGGGRGGTFGGTGGSAPGTGGAGPMGTGGVIGTPGTGGAVTMTGSGGAVGNGSGGTPDVGTGGASSSGGSGGAEIGGTTGGAGMPGTGGRSAGTGGAGAMGGRGGATGGTAGTAGSTGAGGAADDLAAAKVLNGFTLLKPCVSGFVPTKNPDGHCCCEEIAANENQHTTKSFGGDPNVTYNVKVRIAGIAERYWYTGGTLDTVGKVFYAGGLPTIHSTQAPNTNLGPGRGACKIHPPETDGNMAFPFKVPVEINPSDGCFNGFNIFAMTVSTPKQSYYLNQTTDYDNVDRQPHKVYKTDYTVTIPIRGGATLDFYTLDGDHHQVTNDGTMTVPNVKTSQPYNGNFLEFTVIDVTRAP